MSSALEVWRRQLDCPLPQVDAIFPAALAAAESVFDDAALARWVAGAARLCHLGRGLDLPVIWLQNLPPAAAVAGDALLDDALELALWMSRASVPKGIAPMLASLPAVARRLETAELINLYFDLVRRIAQEAPNGLAPFFDQIETVLAQVGIGGLRNWVQFGLRGYRTQPHQVADYFSLQSADARAVLQRERRGTLLVDADRALRLTLRALWDSDEDLVPYTAAYDLDRAPRPFLDRAGLHLPDVLDDEAGVAGLDRYRATLAHLAAHRRWTTPLIADNFNRYQQIFIEVFEDARVEWLAMRELPGLRSLWLRLHPQPAAAGCPDGWSPVRHLAAQLSRALLDPAHGYRDATLLDFVAQFHARVAADPHAPHLAAELGVAYLVRVHTPSFRAPQVYFTDTEVTYRDDNRYLWIFLEDTDDEDDFHSEHHVANARAQDSPGLSLARHHPEWDARMPGYRPDWVTVYERLPEAGAAAAIEQVLDAHARLRRQLSRALDALKPQGRVRQRYQEDGDALDLDVALRAVVDARSGATPDPRIHIRHVPDHRDVAVSVLIDLSASINDTPAGMPQSLLALSQTAVALLGWAIDQLGDPFAIAGFSSNTRHDVRFSHFKTFGEPWNDAVKARLAGMQGGLSTRVGAALRHAGHYLGKRPNARKLLLLLTDGEPFDIDVGDPGYLHEDARKAVEELCSQGIVTHCITLDARADDYVAALFGAHRYTVIDRIERLPEKLPRLFMSLTH